RLLEREEEACPRRHGLGDPADRRPDHRDAEPDAFDVRDTERLVGGEKTAEVEGADEVDEPTALSRLVYEPGRCQVGMPGQPGGRRPDRDHLDRLTPTLERRRDVEQEGTTLPLPISADDPEPEW